MVAAAAVDDGAVFDVSLLMPARGETNGVANDDDDDALLIHIQKSRQQKPWHTPPPQPPAVENAKEERAHLLHGFNVRDKEIVR